MSEHVWAADWSDHLARLLQDRGYDSLTEFLADHPATPYRSLCDLLGGSVAPIQLISVKYNEAKTAGTTRDAAKDGLARCVVEQLPDGWGVGDNLEWQVVRALSGWSSEIIVTGDHPELEPQLDAVAVALRKLSPAEGWLPIGPNDDLINKVFDTAWPAQT